ncbi:MAG: hypothetical protein SOX46_03310 [Clostridiaceae bacterium]|uniref:Uncharacterized protein n=1 Tax=Clostridium porci TaxID=2605778 RepID=A0A7X2TC57_9CLOT|nr:hypothetical protein [Clostridium porci]MDY3230594.1 hypothetical protein [Clostridiaceae bacterium]MSS36609.1 hypothetical protein [Clostridium porci]
MKQTMVYIGPSIQNVIVTGTAFYGGYPPHIEAALRRHPYLNDLMVPVQELSHARKEVRNPESALGRIYRKAEGGNLYGL